MNNYKQENRASLRSSLFLRSYLRPALPLSPRMRPALGNYSATKRGIARLPCRDLSTLTIEAYDSQSLMSRYILPEYFKAADSPTIHVQE